MSRMYFDFSDKVVVVTGAANGIGAACARLFSSSGARLALWDIDAAAAQALAAELGNEAKSIRCNVASRSEVEAATARPEAESEPEPERAPHAEDVVPADDEPEGEDVLEETPEFLQETPEHDRLWFEQKPPRDFDF